MSTLDQSTKTICDLIESCRDTQEGFLWAAEAAANYGLKRLFGLYAQQQSRFAEELGGWATADSRSGPRAAATCQDRSGRLDEAWLLSDCLRRERSALALYRKALEERTLPTKARFLVAAQLALLERVHNRMEAMDPATDAKISGVAAYPSATV